MLAQTINEDSESFGLSDFQTILRPLLDWDHEVLNLLIIYLTHHTRDFKGFILVSVRIDSFKDLVSCHRDNSFVLTVTDHGVTFA